jgi:hypothetical protein
MWKKDQAIVAATTMEYQMLASYDLRSMK